MRKGAFYAVVWLLAAAAAAQVPRRDQSVKSIPNTDAVGGFFFPEWENSSSSSHVGIFPVSRLAGYTLVDAHRSTESVSAISGRPFVFHTGPDYWGWSGPWSLPWPVCFHSRSYPVEKVGVKELSAGPTDQNVVHLGVGMNRETVTGILGAPDQKVLLEGREVWQYPGYTLVFEAGALKEIR